MTCSRSLPSDPSCCREDSPILQGLPSQPPFGLMQHHTAAFMSRDSWIQNRLARGQRPDLIDILDEAIRIAEQPLLPSSVTTVSATSVVEPNTDSANDGATGGSTVPKV